MIFIVVIGRLGWNSGGLFEGKKGILLKQIFYFLYGGGEDERQIEGAVLQAEEFEVTDQYKGQNQGT